jgi:hypothetical protein
MSGGNGRSKSSMNHARNNTGMIHSAYFGSIKYTGLKQNSDMHGTSQSNDISVDDRSDLREG